ncbi:MAG: 4Fe-4S dicluster domain-containing protein [Ramlibacter sp.]|nr:4Fe-4S dicluster domain-containing protein [Ramlibacter sp.]
MRQVNAKAPRSPRARRIPALNRLLPELFRTLFRHRTTVRFPFAPVELPAQYRGVLTLHEDLCKGCGQCVRDCPADALELERNGRDRFRLIHYVDRCAYCSECQHRCHFGAIELVSGLLPGSTDRDRLTRVLVERNGD